MPLMRSRVVRVHLAAERGDVVAPHGPQYQWRPSRGGRRAARPTLLALPRGCSPRRASTSSASRSTVASSARRASPGLRSGPATSTSEPCGHAPRLAAGLSQIAIVLAGETSRSARGATVERGAPIGARGSGSRSRASSVVGSSPPRRRRSRSTARYDARRGRRRGAEDCRRRRWRSVRPRGSVDQERARGRRGRSVARRRLAVALSTSWARGVERRARRPRHEPSSRRIGPAERRAPPARGGARLTVDGSFRRDALLRRGVGATVDGGSRSTRRGRSGEPAGAPTLGDREPRRCAPASAASSGLASCVRDVGGARRRSARPLVELCSTRSRPRGSRGSPSP